MIGLLVGAAVYVVALGKWPAAIAVCVLAVLGWKRLGRQALLIAGAALISAWWIVGALPPPISLNQINVQQDMHLYVNSMPQQREYGWDFIATILEGEARDFRVLVHSTDPTPPTRGSHIYVSGPIISRGEPDSVLDYLAGMGVSGEIYTSEVIVVQTGSGPVAWPSEFRTETVLRIQRSIPGDAGALVAGFVTGDDGRLSPSSDDQFRAAGLSHLTAVSGSNLAMLLTMVGIVTYAMGRWRRSLVVVGVVLVWGYAIFVGLPPPTFRAALLATMAAGARMSGRPVDFVSLTLLAVPLQIAIRPEDAYSVSFHLSVAASFGLAAGFSRYPRMEQRHGLAELLTATAFAQLATLPIITGVFGTAPLLSLLANIAAIPFAGFAFAVGLVGSLGLLIHADLGTAMLIPAGWAADIVLRIADLFGQTWSQFQIGPFSDAWMVGLTLLAAFVLLGFSGELTLIRRQLSQRQGIQAENG